MPYAVYFLLCLEVFRSFLVFLEVFKNREALFLLNEYLAIISFKIESSEVDFFLSSAIFRATRLGSTPVTDPPPVAPPPPTLAAAR